MSALALPVLTPKQYLEIERQSDLRHEYLDGIMYAMAGGTPRHSALSVAIASELRLALRGRGCTVYNADLRFEVSDEGPYFYPDAWVACGSASTPVLVVEVLSKSTEKFDRNTKFLKYQKLDCLREYVLLSQSEPRIETRVRDNKGVWREKTFAGIDAICQFESIDASIPLASIYEGLPTE